MHSWRFGHSRKPRMSFGRHALRLTDHQWVWMVFANPSMVKYGKFFFLAHGHCGWFILGHTIFHPAVKVGEPAGHAMETLEVVMIWIDSSHTLRCLACLILGQID